MLALCVAPARAFDAAQCFFAGCAVGDTVVTAPTPRSGPGCSSQGATIYAFALAHPMLPPGVERESVETRLRLEAGARTREEALSRCHPVPAGQRAKVAEIGADKTGLLQISPTDGSPPYWVSNLDVLKR